MQIVYVAYRVPFPPNKGERIRAYHQIRSLGERAEVHLVCPTSDHVDPGAIAALEAHCTSVTIVSDSTLASRGREIARFVSGDPRVAGTYSTPALRQTVAALVSRHSIDWVFLSGVFVAEAARGLSGVRRAIDLIDVYSQVWKEEAPTRARPIRWASSIEARRLAAYEVEIAEEFELVLLASEAEADLFRPRVPGRQVQVVGNGVDLDYFSPVTNCERAVPADFVFAGSMDYVANVDAVCHFYEEVFARLRERHPQVTFTIVGRDPVGRVRKLARDPGVRVTGTVEDVRPYLSRATAAVAPMRMGQGIQNKVLEAMAMGLPVVGTSRAFAGLRNPAGDAVRRADDALAFATELDTLIVDEALRQARGAAARRFVEQHHRWEDRGDELFTIL